jgi:hypothetical protein
MAADRNDTERETERQPRPASITTQPPIIASVEDDDRVVFWSWDMPLVPANSNR